MKKKIIYIWEGVDQYGKNVKGEIAALSINLARFQLLKKNRQITKLAKKKRSLFARSQIKHFEIIIFFRQLATLLHSGIPLMQALYMLQLQMKNIFFANILQSLGTDLSAGKTFSSALRKFPGQFDYMICSVIYAGEKSGTLDKIIFRLCLYKEKILKLKRKLLQALFYPLTVVLMAMGVSLIMLVIVIPRFADFFQSAHCTLPLLTRIILFISHMLRAGWLEILGLILLIMGLIRYSLRHQKCKFLFDKTYLNLPLIGILIKKWVLAYFARHLATLLTAAIPLNEALRTSAAMVRNHSYLVAIQDLEAGVLAGKPLYVMMHHNELFLPLMRQLVQIGEESGTLEKMLEKLADFYEEDLDYSLEHINRLLEPLIMILLGVLIGGLVMAMYLPIFQLGTTI